MEFRHLGTTSLETYGMLQVGGCQVQQRHDELLRLVERAGLRERLFFAEPIVTWPSDGVQGHVAWYADTTGGAQAFASLTGQAYDRARDLLGNALSTLLATSLGPDEAALVQAACVLATIDGVLVDGERVVLFEWGLVPGRSGRAPTGNPPLAATPLAPFLPSHPDAREVSLPGSKDAFPAPMPSPPSETGSAGQASPQVPGNWSSSAEPGTGRFAWHAATAALFALLGFLAGMRMVAPGRLADWLDLGRL